MSEFSYYGIKQVDELTLRNYVALIREVGERIARRRKELIKDLSYAVRIANAEGDQYKEALETLDNPQSEDE